MHDRKFSPERMARLDRPDRTKEYDFPGIISGIGITGGMTIADIGAGTGFFSFPFSMAVGSKGKVMAVDISQEMLDALRSKMDAQRVSNIETVHSFEDKIPIPASSVDIAFMSNVFHELEGVGTLMEIKRILKPSGKLAIIDYRKKHEESGPPYHHRLSRQTVKNTCSKTGFKFSEEFIPGSGSRYGLIFIKK
ncbi:MAG: class I SAM-dependent methyltransferase [Candidatus Thermoplasmatota archaeon]|nr:class I SAM-dependent methyltransferase [Euryarchaeota archaeon]MBU4032869.1 class I SAM-dependent methyltransferase [Candidatus Thermoplasmatota archaeon]MBU4072382.1 class I SAM-dependent methyltransferase [Candidatus Thermoplasmatota archaeon]MBU4144088.1 class I SAM-dependent methyltransferase [Candidatus Thermoplasmatota archaeon]MBU4590980.1 class I SAM-dependent methyltransferase [Candidatus Thermoplasmatota archaeon]